VNVPVVKKGETAAKPKVRAGGARKPEARKPDEESPDALMATTLKAMEWAAKKRRQLIYAALAVVGVGAIMAGWVWYRGNREEKASTLVAKAVAAELAPIRQGDEDPEVLKRIQFYGSEDEKQKAALASFTEARTKYGDTGPGILARLGEAGVHLDRREWDEAIAAYSDVRSSSLAAADPNVRIRCIEGVGYAREGKGLVDDARRSFDELSQVDVKGAKPLGLYHLARLDMVKGDKDAAMNKLKTAREIVQAPGGPAARFLKDQIDKMMTKIDPNSVPKAPPGMGGFPGMGGMPGGMPGGGALTPEQLEMLMKSAGGGGGAPPPKGP
jgi:hypothetical protein